jgi:hypothetical protein
MLRDDSERQESLLALAKRKNFTKLRQVTMQAARFLLGL